MKIKKFLSLMALTTMLCTCATPILANEPFYWQKTGQYYSIDIDNGYVSTGSTGSKVAFAQDLLYQLGYLTGDYSTAVDGVFGSNTYRAVKSFQRDHGLSVDGKVGPTTFNALVQQLQ